MKAMIFAAGLGTRLKPLTDTMPKALVQVDGHPLLDITLSRLINAGATEAVVNIHHFGEQIIKYVESHNWGIPVRISDERNELLDTGGGLREAQSLFSDDEAPILIHNVDILSNADIPTFYQQSKTNDVTLLVSERETQRYLLFDDDMRLCGWTNIATGEVRTPYPALNVEKMHRYAFSGIHSFSPKLFERMESYPQKFPIMDFYLKECKETNIRAVLQPSLRLLDVGKQDTIQKAVRFLKGL